MRLSPGVRCRTGAMASVEPPPTEGSSVHNRSPAVRRVDVNVAIHGDGCLRISQIHHRSFLSFAVLRWRELPARLSEEGEEMGARTKKAGGMFAARSLHSEV